MGGNQTTHVQTNTGPQQQKHRPWENTKGRERNEQQQTTHLKVTPAKSSAHIRTWTTKPTVSLSGWHLKFDGNELEQIDGVRCGYVRQVSPSAPDRTGRHARRPRQIERLKGSQARQVVDFHLQRSSRRQEGRQA